MYDDQSTHGKLFERNKSKNVKNNVQAENFHDLENENHSKLKVNACTSLNSNVIELENKVASNRSNNLIIFGIKEQTNEINHKGDKLNVEKLLMALNICFIDEILDIKRIESNKNGNKPRPILVKLKNFESRSLILKKAKQLREKDEYQNVAISPDYSREKRLKIKLLIKTRINLNKQLKVQTPDADFYFSIKCGSITMLDKKQEPIQNKDIVNEASIKQCLKTVNHCSINLEKEKTKSATKIKQHKPSKEISSTLARIDNIMNFKTDGFIKRIEELTSKVIVLENEREKMSSKLDHVASKLEKIDFKQLFSIYPT
jgi:hypothetical protein